MSKVELRVMPANLEAEKALLGGILLNAELVNEAKQFVRPEDFFLDSHRQIFMAMSILAERGAAVDMVTIQNELVKNRMDVGGVQYICSLVDGVPHSPSIAQYAQIVSEKARLRRLIVATQTAAAKGLEGQDAIDIIGELEAEMSEMVEQRSRVKTLPEIGFSFLEGLYKARSISRDTLGFSYGLPTLDALTTGIREADYTIIAGRSGNGKSALVRQIAVANVRAGVKVLVFTPEITSEQFFSLLLPLETTIPFYKIRNPRELNDTDLVNTREGTDRIMQWPLLVDDTTGITISELVAKARLHINKGVELIIVDYLQLVQHESAKDERSRINAVSAGLRNLAKSTRVPVIALSQLSRPNDKNHNERPTMFHLKESGNLEQDAFNILLLYRPMDAGEFTGNDEIIIAKQRFGDAGTFIPVGFNKRTVSYGERA